MLIKSYTTLGLVVNLIKCCCINVVYIDSLIRVMFYACLSHDVASGSEITPWNKIDKPLVVYRFTGNVMTSITKLHTCI